jgi:glutaminyl-peptide cyclotransferase
MRKSRLKKCAARLAALALSAVGLGCQTPPVGNVGRAPAAATPSATPAVARSSSEVPTYTYEVVNSWPHDRAAFTQGLVFHDGYLLESTGQYGESTLRKVELKTGKVVKSVKVAREFFAEGLALLGGKLFQLTWTTRKGFIYDPVSFKSEGEFFYDGEGWGLTQDGASLILSDGTNQIRFLDPKTFKVSRTINVLDGGRPVREINELEYVKGEIFANVWKTDRIARIDPQTGALKGWIDLKGIISPAERGNDTDAVLNGIAYDERGDRLFVTGKLWPKLFEIRLKEGR